MRSLKALRVVLVALLGLVTPALAQFGGEGTPTPEQLVKVNAAPVTLAPGGRGTVTLHLAILPGWHVNANPPALDYNIPTEVSLAGSGITAGKPAYPAGKQQKFEFEETPLLVYDGAVDITVPLQAATNAASGTLSGTVAFQACNDQVCLAPAKVTFSIPLTISGSAPAPSATPAPTESVEPAPTPRDPNSFSTAAPAGGAASATAKNKLEQALATGGIAWLAALFVGGLLLNLTPCVFPMLGITVSIFGARRKEPMPKVVANAVLYVLGICVTYTALGVVAALTGGLFGAALQNPWVTVGLGALMVVLALSMFGVYEMNPPGWLMDKLGGAQATNMAGAFVSGLGVGVVAAPCVGPFVVGLLAIVAQKGSVAFGVQALFTLSLGLGFPYLFLAMFSNFLQMLPRSGNWMVRVKGGFGILMTAFGVYFMSLGLVPQFAPWILPLTLVVFGVWMGGMKSTGPNAKRINLSRMITGALMLFVGVVMGTEMYMAGARTLTWKPYSPEAVAASVAAGRPVMMDFSADWCVPCHELELNTFTNERVVSEAKKFDRYKVDLTKYDAPESAAARKQYGITGVPTVVFLDAQGREIAPARVEGFLPPEPFLQQMKLGATR